VNRKALFQRYPRRLDIAVYLLLSTSTLWAGLHFPVLTVRKIWEKNTFTVLSGIRDLMHDGQLFLAAVVFFFSIVFPIVKLAALYAIWVVPMRPESRRRILHGLSMLGKWSMLDVFIVAVIIVSVKLGALASAKAEQGIYFFGISILFAMLATAVETRLARKDF